VTGVSPGNATITGFFSYLSSALTVTVANPSSAPVR
jgi:hypothetical protein